MEYGHFYFLWDGTHEALVYCHGLYHCNVRSSRHNRWITRADEPVVVDTIFEALNALHGCKFSEQQCIQITEDKYDSLLRGWHEITRDPLT